MVSRVIVVLAIFVSLTYANNDTDMYANDALDQSKTTMRSIHMTVCEATLGTHQGLYVKVYRGDERHFTCKEIDLLGDVTVMPHDTGKRESGNAGSIGFGKKPNQCHLELTKTDGKLTGIPYGDKHVCSSIRAEGTIVLSENKKQKEDKRKTPDNPYVVKIFKYGAPDGSGQTFSSMDLCEEEQVRLSKANAGLDYSYKCVKK